MKTNEQIIRDFLEQMATQDNRSTAFPFYYTIRTEVRDFGIEDANETVVIWQDEEYESIDALKASLIEGGAGKDDWQFALVEAREVGIRRRWEDRGMFLTETDAEIHLRANHYHYSSNAHTYVHHAWRAPGLSEFFNALGEHFGVKLTR